MRLAHLSAALVGAALAVAVLPSTADATSAVRLGKIQYDSPGSDDRSNSSLNAEWVTITNHASTRRTLTGWSLRDAQSHVYRFPSFSLAAGASVRVHTGRGSNGAYNLYWGSSSYIWNNTGDKATLKNGAGTTLDTCSWGSGSGSVYC
jgi:Lamin Tail Domain